MSKLLMSAAALALCLGTSAALAQQDTQKTTTVTTPEGTTQTMTHTTTSNDGYLQYRKTVTSTRHYNAGPFDAPDGYSYTRYSVGQRVPSVLLDGDVTLPDYADYQLMAPPPGLTWIRVGDDALLVDQSNGEVIQADYNLFSS
jgi:Ni/Co efflux regulator RcnB